MLSLSGTKMYAILVSGDIKLMRIFTRVLARGGVIDGRVVESNPF